MNLLQMPEDEAYSIIGGVWHPGQTTPIHDHLTWALIGVYEGEEREALFRRTDDGSNPRLAKIEPVSERVHKKGQVTVLGHKGIHRVDNISLRPTFSVHVYGRDIGNAERHSYDPVTGNKPLRLWVLQCPTRPRKILAGQLSARLPPNLPPGHLSGTRLAYGLSRNELAPFPLGI